jgi:copper homeostasis protein
MTSEPAPPKLEVCVDSADACVAAAEGGADRVELCADLAEGGIMPSAGMIRTACRAVGIPVMVIIRPRGGDFVASPREVEAMEADIAIARSGRRSRRRRRQPDSRGGDR